MAQLTAFGKSIKKRLIDIERTNTWLCEEVAKKSGKYFDDGMLSRICRGQIKPFMAASVQAIREILDLPDEKEDSV